MKTLKELEKEHGISYEDVASAIRDRIKEIDEIQKKQVELFGGIDKVLDGAKVELMRLLGDEP